MSKEDINIYIMRGLMGFMFPKAMYPLAEMLKATDYNVKMLSWQVNYRNYILKDIRNTVKTKKNQRIVIIGHSMGGNTTTELTQLLAKEGIILHYAAVIDAPMPKTIGKTTLVVDNFYQFNDFRNPILKADDPSVTVLKQYNFRRKDDKTGIYVEPEDHIGLGNHPFVISTIVDQIKKLS